MKISTCLSLDHGIFPAIPFQGDVENNIKKIKEIGFDGIDLMIGDPDTVDRANIIRAIVDSGFVIPAIGTGKAWSDEGLSFTDPNKDIREQALRRIEGHLRFAAEAESQVIIGLMRGILQPGVSLEQARYWMNEAFKYCMDEAERLEVRVAVEPINRYETTLINTISEGLELIETVGSKRLGLLIDSFHMNIEEPIIRDSVLAAGDTIYHVHYADSNRLYPGRGHFDFRGMIKALMDTGYQGFISGEHLPDPDPAQAVKAGMEYMKKTIKDLT